MHAPFVRHVRAIDFSRNMIAIARENLAKTEVRNVDFEIASISDLVGVKNAYDVVMAMSILHLLDDRAAVLAKVHQLLKPGGVFVSSTACVSRTATLKVLLPIGKALGLLPTLNFMTRTQLERDIRDVGFQIEECWQPREGAAVFMVTRKPA